MGLVVATQWSPLLHRRSHQGRRRSQSSGHQSSLGEKAGPCGGVSGPPAPCPAAPLRRPGSLTDARDDAEEVVDALVYCCGDDSNAREGVGHRVDTHLRHKQR